MLSLIDHIATPAGERCDWCGEPIDAKDAGVAFQEIEETKIAVPGGLMARARLKPEHYACFLRAIIGSVAHLRRECSCYRPDSTCGDPPGMTKRKAALAAVDLFELRKKVCNE